MITKIHKYTTGHNAGKTISYIVDGEGKVVAKECNECDKMIELTKFSPLKTGLFYHDVKCRPCKSECNGKIQKRKYDTNEEFREWKKNLYHDGKTDYWTIYLIDNFDGLGNHYVGQTQNLPYRLATHRFAGADTSYTLEMDRAPTQELAYEYEAEYHKRGYCGAKGCPKYKEMEERHKNK